VWWDLNRKRKAQKVLADLVNVVTRPAAGPDNKPISVTPFGGIEAPDRPADDDAAGSGMGKAKPKKDLSVTPFAASSEVVLEPIEPGDTKRERGKKPLTPFPDASQSPAPNRIQLQHEIFKTWRDKEIDKMVESDQLDKALDTATRKLEKARECGDRQSSQLYEAYASEIRAFVMKLSVPGEDEKSPHENGENIPKPTDSFF
jgi:hypothetical protein